MGKDIFDIDCIDSLVREGMRIASNGEFDLKKFDISPYENKGGYEFSEFRFSPENYSDEIESAIEPIVKCAKKKGCNPNLFTALYEAVLNAYQHGNKKNPDKKVTIAHQIKDDSVEIAVIDEGGLIDPEFVSFVLRHREGMHKKKFMDFYEFSGKEKPRDHHGTGTSFMHIYVDKVAYFKSTKGGLVVHLTKHI